MSVLFYSCDKEDNDSTVSSINEKSIIIDNTLYNTGYGYSILRERPFNFAIDINSFNDWEVKDFPESIDLDIQVIKTNEDLNEFIESSFDDQSENPYIYYSKTDIQDKLTISSNTINIIARISIDRYKYMLEPNERIVFNDRAQSLINTDQIDRFLGRYGARYIKTAILGGDIYYIYSYDISTFNQEQRVIFEENARINAENVYGIGNGSISNEARQDIVNSTISYEAVSTVSGYSPSLVSDENSVQNEIQRVLQYLTANPTSSAVRQMTFAPYSEIESLQELDDAFYQENKCYDDLQKWKKIQARILFVFNNTLDQMVKLEAESALNTINQNIANSLQCINSITPEDNLYSDITL